MCLCMMCPAFSWLASDANFSLANSSKPPQCVGGKQRTFLAINFMSGLLGDVQFKHHLFTHVQEEEQAVN